MHDPYRRLENSALYFVSIVFNDCFRPKMNGQIGYLQLVRIAKYA